MQIKFTGDFKDLIPMGFTFHKLFANNYKVYERDKVWIWVAHGGYVEISDHYSNSIHIAKMIVDGTYPLYEKDVNYGDKLAWMDIKKGDILPCTINRKTGKIMGTIDFMRSVGGHDKYVDLPDIDDYRDVSLSKKTMETIKELADKGMIEV